MDASAPHPHKPRRTWLIPAIVALIIFIGQVASNLVAADLDTVLKPYRPVVWVVFGLALITAVATAIADARKQTAPPAAPPPGTSGPSVTIQHAQAGRDIIAVAGDQVTTFDQRDQTVQTQTNIAGDVHGPVLSGEFHGPVTIGAGASATIPPLPLQRPRRAEHFTGRKDELARLLQDLQPGRVVTRCGPGGIGKTALAAEAIWTLAPGSDPPARFPDGIIFHTFYHQPQVDLALEAIARAYGQDPRPNPAEAAQRVLSNRCALIVLDGAENADDLDAVLRVTGRCGVLITSRRHQDAPADWQDITPLPTPQAVELLQAWGGSCAADDAAAKRICELVGGLPLAVRLAGRYLAQCRQQTVEYLAWLQATPLTALDLGRRQSESVPILMQRSLNQVTEATRQALAVVGLLDQAPFARELVALALDAPVDAIGRSLGELVDYGLLLRADQRYQVSHALVHTYAHHRLSQPADAVPRLAAYYGALARQQGELGPAGYAVLDLERPHIMAILSACVATQHWEQARSLVWAIDDYLDLQGHWTEWVIALNAGLTAARASSDRRGEGNALGNLGLAYAALGDARRAIEFYEQHRDIAREIGDRRGEGAALGNLGNAYAALGEPRRAIEFYEQHRDIAREIGDRRGEGAALGNLGLAYLALGEPRRAIEF